MKVVMLIISITSVLLMLPYAWAPAFTRLLVPLFWYRMKSMTRKGCGGLPSTQPPDSFLIVSWKNMGKKKSQEVLKV
jgi:hypothetical protein